MAVGQAGGGTGRNKRKPELRAAGMIIWQVCQPGLALLSNPDCSKPVAVPFRQHTCVRVGSQDHLKHCAFELSSLIKAPPWCKAGRKGNSELQVGGRPCRPVGNCQCSSAAGAGCRCRCWRSLGFYFLKKKILNTNCCAKSHKLFAHKTQKNAKTNG